MGFLKSLFGLFGKSKSAGTPAPASVAHAGPHHDEEDRTTVMSRKQFADVTDRVTEQTTRKK